eukprot:TRINITY_DN94010_c0_g1_i1.p1 TRINITY_DN94010_c0_g1~~TRINITY_DN94010_c0_g1_i1.p1  ORF type:complete len:354 (+),score=52.74 TRINITY_DN94010_c0_g1_i1:52-1113(+)
MNAYPLLASVGRARACVGEGSFREAWLSTCTFQRRTTSCTASSIKTQESSSSRWCSAPFVGAGCCWFRRNRKSTRRAMEKSRGFAGQAEAPALYAAIVASAVFMFLWVFFLPGSAWIGSDVERDAWVKQTYEQYFEFFAPSSIILKYKSLGPLVELTHALPGAVWALLAPLQLSPPVREVQGGLLHRALGRLMLLAAGVLMCGYALIDANSLYADVSDFAGHGGGIADSLDAFNSQSLAGALPPFNLGGVRFLAAWFVFTGVMTFSTVQSNKPDFSSHRHWALRHIAVGLWVAMQRPLFAAVRVLQGAALGSAASLPEVQADAFYYSAYFVTALYVVVAEWTIWNDSPQRQKE